MATRQVKVHAHGCTPDTLELTKYEDKVVFILGDAKAPQVVHVDQHALFGTTTCAVGKTAEEATAYVPKAVGNYRISLTASASPGEAGAVQVLCLASGKALGVGGTGSIKVTG